MSRIRECFACGTLLAQTERRRVEVKHKRDKMRVAEVCTTCWYTIAAKQEVRVAKNGKSYRVAVRTLQTELFGKTARALIGRGGRHV